MSDILQAVRELHAPNPGHYGLPFCDGCNMGGYEPEEPPWPCRTADLIYTAEEIAEIARAAQTRRDEIATIMNENRRLDCLDTEHSDSPDHYCVRRVDHPPRITAQQLSHEEQVERAAKEFSLSARLLDAWRADIDFQLAQEPIGGGDSA